MRMGAAFWFPMILATTRSYALQITPICWLTEFLPAILSTLTLKHGLCWIRLRKSIGLTLNMQRTRHEKPLR